LQSGVALAAQTFSNSGAKAGNGLLGSLEKLPSLLSGITGGGTATNVGVTANGGGGGAIGTVLGAAGSLFGGGSKSGPKFALGGGGDSGLNFGGFNPAQSSGGGFNFSGGSFGAQQQSGGGGALATSLLQSFAQPRVGGSNALTKIFDAGGGVKAPTIAPTLPTTNNSGGLLGGLVQNNASGSGSSFVGAFTGATSKLNTSGFKGPVAKTGGGMGAAGWANIALTALPLILGLFGKKKKDTSPDDRKIARIGVNTYESRKKNGAWVQDKLVTPDWAKLNAKYKSEAVGNYSAGNMSEVVRNFAEGGMVNVPNFMMGGSLEPKSSIPRKPSINTPMKVRGFASGGMVNVPNFLMGSMDELGPKSIIPRKPSINAPMKVRGFASGNLKELSNSVPNFADGSLKGMSGGGPKVQRSFMRGVPSPEALEAALKREGSNGVVSVLQPSELILSPKQTQKFFSMGMDRQLSSNTPSFNVGNNVPSFNSGNMTSFVPTFASGGLVGNTSNSLSVDVPININQEGGGSGGSKADASEIRNAWIVR
jgi:hypothetical protein